MHPFARQDRLWMELHAVNWILLVPQRHHRPIVFGLRGNLEVVWKIASLDDERVVARDREGAGDVGEDAPPIMFDGGGLAVHRRGCADDGAAEGHTNRLMTETDAKQRH